jgi:alkylmercury lyase-like protein
MKPLLPAVDAAGLVREAGFALLLRDHRPVELADLALATGIDVEVARGTVSSLAQAGWLDLDGSGLVVGAAGLSLSTGAHRLTLDAAPFRTWCAYDSLGIAAALGGDAQVETTCGQCHAPISLAFRAGSPERDGPERLWLANGGADLRGSFCAPTVLLCGEEHGATWAAGQRGRGRLLDLAEGARQGGIDWAGCADAVNRLS